MNTNDSTEQTANVLKAIALDYEGADLSEWVDYQRWLASDAAEHRVVDPFAVDAGRSGPAVGGAVAPGLQLRCWR